MATGGLRRMMVALAQRSDLSRSQLAVRAGLSAKSGTFGTYLGKLRSENWVGDRGGKFSLTESGVTALGEFQPLPQGRELLAYWMNELGGGPARLLNVLANVYPSAMNRNDLALAADLSPGSGTFGTYLGKLRTLELIQGSGEISLSPELSDRGAA